LSEKIGSLSSFPKRSINFKSKKASLRKISSHSSEEDNPSETDTLYSKLRIQKRLRLTRKSKHSKFQTYNLEKRQTNHTLGNITTISERPNDQYN
jgi:hypothetical protein